MKVPAGISNEGLYFLCKKAENDHLCRILEKMKLEVGSRIRYGSDGYTYQVLSITRKGRRGGYAAVLNEATGKRTHLELRSIARHYQVL